MRTPRSTIRGAGLLVVGSLLLLAGVTGATVAQAKRSEGKAPPGQVKKLPPGPTPQPAAPPAPPAPVEHTTKTVKHEKAPRLEGATPRWEREAKPERQWRPDRQWRPEKQWKPDKQPKPDHHPKPEGTPPPTPTAPSKARDPKPVAQPQPQPAPSEPSAPALAAVAPPAAPATAPPAPAPVQVQAPPKTGAAEQQRLGSGDRRRGLRAPPTRTASAFAPGSASTETLGIARSSSTDGPLAGTADDASPISANDDERAAPKQDSSPVVRTVRDIVEVVPDSVKLALAALAALSLVLGGAYLLSVLRVRSLARQRGELLSDVGLLQSALLPPVPGRVGALETSVAYRPADGLGAGGDFYDVLPLPGGRAGFILGDVSGHGRDALERTAFLRYTLRAYLEAGLEPRIALQVAGRVIGDGLGGDFATVLLAVHDPRRGSLTYASAGHPAPIVTGGPAFEPVLAGSSPPIGAGLRTGLRQTTVPLTPGVIACLYTDGLIEARTDEGLLGRERLARILAELGRDATAAAVIERVADEARSASDDMAVCLLSPTATVTSGGFRTEQLELSAEEAEGPLPGSFLEECGVGGDAREDVERELRDVAERHDGAVLHATFGSRRTVEVLPCNVESIEAASRHTVAV